MARMGKWSRSTYYEVSHQEGITWASPRICLDDSANTTGDKAAQLLAGVCGICFTRKPVKIILPPESVSVSSSQDPVTRFSEKRVWQS